MMFVVGQVGVGTQRMVNKPPCGCPWERTITTGLCVQTWEIGAYV